MRKCPFQPMANVVSVSSMWIGSLSPSRASLAASRSAGGRNPASPGFGEDRIGSPASGQRCGEPIGGVEQPGIAGFGGEQDQLTEGDDAAVVIGCSALNIAHLIRQTETLALYDPPAGSTLDCFPTTGGSPGNCHGIVHPAVRRPARLRLPLLRPHCHLRLPQRSRAP